LVRQLAIALALTGLSLDVGHGADIHGVVTRKGLPVQSAPVASRYRSTGVEQAALRASEHCNCQPSLYAVVSLWSEEAAPPRSRAQRPTMAQKDKRFVPTVLAVQVGDTVSFPNFDPYFHNVFSYSKVKRFDLGRYAEGASAEVVFDKPGVAQVFCEIHSSMRAYIHVFDTPYFAVSDEQGRFKVEDVPEGAYRLRVWQEGLPELEQVVEVSSDSVFVEVAP
jgi:plastocyanin